MIYRVNQLTGIYMMATLAFKELKNIGAKLQTCSKQLLERCFPVNRKLFHQPSFKPPESRFLSVCNNTLLKMASFINKVLLESYLRKNRDEIPIEKYSCFMIRLRVT